MNKRNFEILLFFQINRILFSPNGFLTRKTKFNWFEIKYSSIIFNFLISTFLPRRPTGRTTAEKQMRDRKIQHHGPYTEGCESQNMKTNQPISIKFEI